MNDFNDPIEMRKKCDMMYVDCRAISWRSIKKEWQKEHVKRQQSWTHTHTHITHWSRLRCFGYWLIGNVLNVLIYRRIRHTQR